MVDEARKDGLHLLSVILIIVSAAFLIRELYHWTTLPSWNDEAYGLISLIKYKENTYKQIFVWLVVIATGLSNWSKKGVNWFLYQSLIVFICTIPLTYQHLYSSNILGLPTIFVIILIVFTILQLSLNKLQTKYNVRLKKAHRVWAIVSGIFCSTIYFVLKF
ncbi:hypothetical protein [Pontibacter akesuensis]|nr:hypothetical protein [Pontibacter akesuensis]